MSRVDRWVGPGRRPALVISECQNGLINPEHATGLMTGLAQQAQERDIVGRIAALAATFREAELPVCHATIYPAANWEGFDISSPMAAFTRHEDVFKEGSPAAEIHPGLQPLPGDLTFPRRTAMTSFYRSGLGAALRDRDVDTVVLVGISSNIAIPGTAVEAVNRGYPVVIAEDCTAGTTPEIHEFTFANLLRGLATISRSEEIAEAIRSR